MNTTTRKAVSNSTRKAQQLRINLEKDTQSKQLTTGLERYYFVHQALPELDADDIDLSLSFLGKTLTAPLIISSMTGGTREAQRVNRRLAEAAQATGIAMGIGSQRAAIDNRRLSSTYQMRRFAPDILFFANLGAVQLNYGYGVSECQQAVDMIQADGLMLHLNSVQEALQHRGNTNFAGLLGKIEQVCHQLTVPVIVKEVGWGISEKVAQSLAQAGVAGIDVAGAGGTSWSEVEKHLTPNEADKHVAESFASWGISTADSLLMAKRGAPGIALIASGGLRTGIDIAKVIALGADAAGIAAPLLKAAARSTEAVIAAIDQIVKELKIAMLCLGAARLEQLKNSPLLVKREA